MSTFDTANKPGRDTMGLTPAESLARQERVHKFMLAHQAEYGLPASLRECSAALGFTAPNGCIWTLRELMAAGKVRAVTRGYGQKYVAVDPGPETQAKAKRKRKAVRS